MEISSARVSDEKNMTASVDPATVCNVLNHALSITQDIRAQAEAALNEMDGMIGFLISRRIRCVSRATAQDSG